MSTALGISGAALWFTDAWASYRATSRSRSFGPSVQDLLDQGAALANAFASISQDQTTGLAILATSAAKKRVDAQIKALKEQAAGSAGSLVNKTA